MSLPIDRSRKRNTDLFLCKFQVRIEQYLVPCLQPLKNRLGREVKLRRHKPDRSWILIHQMRLPQIF